MQHTKALPFFADIEISSGISTKDEFAFGNEIGTFGVRRTTVQNF